MADNNQQRILWGGGTSRVFRVHWALIELGLPYQQVPLRTRTSDMDHPQFQALSPAKKIPVLQDGELTISESAAIVCYLGERYGKLLPKQIEQRAKYYEWQSMITMELDATSLYVLRRHRDLFAIYGEAPTAVESSEAYFQRMIQAAAERLIRQRGPQASTLLDEFSGVDILMMSCLDWAVRYEQPVPDTLMAYRDGLAQRDGYQKALDANRIKPRMADDTAN